MSSGDTVGTAGVGGGGTSVGSSSLSTASATTTGAKITTSTISGTPIALNSASSTATAIRAIGAGGQATQVRVVMPTNLISAGPSMIKQIESAAAAAAASGRTQITAMPANASAAARTVSNTSITVARPVTQTAYLPRANVTATQMTGIGAATTATGQRLVTPIRATPASGVAGATVTGLTAGGSFVRSATAGTTVNRNSASPATTVISPATSTTWMAANTAGQVQLIRAISHQPRQRIITTQSLNTTSTGGGIGTVAAGAANVLSGTVVAAAAIGGINTIPGNAVVSTQPTQQTQQQQQTQSGNGQSLQSVVSSATAHTSQPQQPTYVATLATVLPPRQHQATLVYSSNVANATVASAGSPPTGTVTQTLAQTQQFSPTLATGQRFAVATSLTAAAAAAANSVAGAPRQIRQIPLAKQISTTKLSTASISIRAPNLPQLAPTIAATTGSALATVGGNAIGTAGAITSGTATVTARSGTVTGIAGSAATASVIPGGNLSTTRIIQLQQQPGGAAQQIIGSTGRLAGNVMLQPFIVNTTGGNKIGLRPPVTMATKGQPSLTITHMGISKLPTTVASATLAAGAQAQTVAASLQGLSSGLTTGATNLSAISPSTASAGVLTTAPTVLGGSSNVSTSSATTNLTSTAGLLTAQNIVSSAGGGGATVVPVAITTRGGTLTSIKNANGITVGKVMTPTATAGGILADSGNSTPTGANVFIQQQQQQRPGSAGLTGATLATISSANTSVVSTPSSSSSAVVTSSAAFLPPGSTIYYESVPASTVQASTGVLSITTTTLTSSTMSQQQTSTAASATSSGLGITSTSLPFVTHAANSTTSFTVVPSSGSGARTIGQLQLPISSSGPGVGTQIQAVRFSAPLTAASVSDAGVQQQVLMAAQVNAAAGSSVSTAQHMVIPLQTSIKVTTAGAPGSTVVSNFLRKRDNAGSSDGALPIRAAKNLAPTLLSMGVAPAASSPSSVSSTSSTLGAMTVASSVPASTTATVLPQSLSPAPSTSSSFSTVSSSGATAQSLNIAAPLTVEALAKKDRANALASTPPRCSRGASPASSEGSTTVSANSSPGVEQQMAQDESGAIVMQHGSHHRGDSNNTHFNPIHELYPNHHQQQQQHKHHSMMMDSVQHQQLGGLMQQSHNTTQRNSVDGQSVHMGAATSSTAITNMPQRLNGSIGSAGAEGPPRKRSRRGTNDSQQSNQSQPSSSFSLPPPAGAGHGIDYNACNTGVQPDDHGNHTSTTQHKAHVAGNTPPQQIGNKENAKPTEYFLRRPRNRTIMSTYKANWKSANNHFQRYTDIKQREERRPTVIDVANQPNIQKKLGGWKVYHLSAQMEDLAENEEASHNHLNDILKRMETHEKDPDTERLCDLLKGNIQRSKIIVDGINEAKNQMMKILDHQSQVSDILSRCASKRNFKKRDKV